MTPGAGHDISTRPSASRRGRPLAGTEEQRRERVLDAAMAELVDTGAQGLTMAAVARRAGASKETLYRWFGDREGLLAALIQRNADQSARQVEQALSDGGSLTDHSVRLILQAYANGLLRLLVGSTSVALNRAAMTDANLRTLLLTQGRHRVGPVVETYLGAADASGVIDVDRVGGVGSAFELLYGLVVRDTQARVLLGEAPPPSAALHQRAEVAIEQFLTLCKPEGSPQGTPRR